MVPLWCVYTNGHSFLTGKYETLQFYPNEHSLLQRSAKFYSCTRAAAGSLAAKYKILRSNWNTKLEIKIWFSLLRWSWDIKHKNKWFFPFQNNWTLKLKFEVYFLFLIFYLKKKKRKNKTNLLKQISYKTSYHLPLRNCKK